MDPNVLQRRKTRAINSQNVAKKAEKLRLEGNQLFTKGRYLAAADKYIDALDVHGPRPMVLSNLAACYNNLGRYSEAENIATTALEYDPRYVKARYRRAIARKHLGHYRAAIKDLNSILSVDPGHQEGLKETAAIQKMMQQHEDFSSPADDHPLDTAAAWEIPEDSDTEDCKHRGDSTCAAYNRGSCKEGRTCSNSHGPDTMSVRDELGKNVCSSFLIGVCRRGNRCDYSHSKVHLPPGGWWEDDQAIADAKQVKDWLDDEDVEYHEFHQQLLEHPKANGFAARREWAELRLHIQAQYETVVEAEKTAKNHKLPASPTEKFVLVVSFDYHRGDYDSDAALLASIARKVKVVDTGKSSNGRGPEMAIQYLDSPHIVAVLLIDAYVVTKPEHAKVAQKLVTYAKNGGTVVMAGQLPSHIRPDDFNRAMKNTWGLNWQSGSYFRSTFQVNSGHDIAKRSPSLVKSYSMKALHLSNIQATDVVYAKTLPAEEAPVVLTKLGQGFVGYVGDVNSETSSETVIIAMLGILDTQKFRSLPADSFILVISFDYEGIFESIHAHLFAEMERKLKVVHVRQISGGKGAETALQQLESPDLVGVLVTDPDVVTVAKYSKLARKLFSYAQAGGKVVLGGQLVSNIRPNDLEKMFKTTWGLSWKTGSYFRSTFHINQGSNVAQLNPSLPKEYSMKAVHISNISPNEAVYAATSTSYTQSAVFPPTKAKDKSKGEEAPVVCAQIGRGRFGFVGDVNGEDESTMTVMAILGILDELVSDQKIVEAFTGTLEK